MNLPLHQILPGEPVPLYAQNVDDSCSILASCRIPSASVSQSSSSSNNTPSTLRIHSLYPLSKLRISERCPHNVKSVHPYGTSNMLFLVLSQSRKGKAREGIPNTDDTASYKIVLWDDKKEEVMLELTFRDPVLNVVLRRDKLVVILERRVVLFHLDLNNEDRAEAILREGEYETVSNPLGESITILLFTKSYRAIPKYHLPLFPYHDRPRFYSYYDWLDTACLSRSASRTCSTYTLAAAPSTSGTTASSRLHQPPGIIKCTPSISNNTHLPSPFLSFTNTNIIQNRLITMHK